MAPKLAEAEAADAQLTGQSPPDAEQVYRMVARLVAWFCPGAREVCITYRVPGAAEPGRIPVPFAGETDDGRAAVLAILGRMRAGEYMGGRAVAAELGMEYEGGHYRSLMSAMVKDGEIESHRQKGYRLPVA